MVELEAYQKTDAYRNFLKKQTERKRKSKRFFVSSGIIIGTRKDYVFANVGRAALIHVFEQTQLIRV